MDLEFTDDQAELRDNVRGVLAGIAAPAVVRAIYEGRGDDAEVWQHMVALDWPALAIPEEFGGLGARFLELAIVVDELGRATAPGPFLATATQFVPAVRELGGAPSHAAFLAPVAAGRSTGTLAIAERGRWRRDAVRATATRVASGWRLDGRKESVVHGATVDEMVVVARGDAGLAAFVVPRHEVRVIAREVIDPTLPVADIVLDGTVVADERVLAEPGPAVGAAIDRVIEESTVAMAVATAATCRRIFETTLQYAKEREQYGRPIGSFQALKHRLADMYLAVERASSLCWFAVLTIAEEDPRRHEAASPAKAAVGECQALIVGDGLQLHGGIGFTWEHDLHFLLKRAKVGDALFGNAIAHRVALAGSLGLLADEREVAL